MYTKLYYAVFSKSFSNVNYVIRKYIIILTVFRYSKYCTFCFLPCTGIQLDYILRYLWDVNGDLNSIQLL